RTGAPLVLTPATLPSGTIGVTYTAQLSASGGIPGYGFGPPAPAAGGSLCSSGFLTIANPQASSITFSVTARDATQPNFQTATVMYTIAFAGQVAANISFTNQPTNSVAGEVLGNSPIVVHVQDNTGAAIAGATVVMAFANQPC